MDTASSSEPRPVAPPVSAAGVFAILGGPLAWFAALNIGYALSSGPCFPGPQRLAAPLPQFAWSSPVLVLLLLVCTLVAFAAFWISWRQVRGGTSAEAASASRQRFAAVWGAVLGGGFCIATLVTAVGLILLPRCMG